MAYFRRFVASTSRKCRVLVQIVSVFLLLHLIFSLLYGVSLLSVCGFTSEEKFPYYENKNSYFFDPQLRQDFLKRKENIYDLRRKAVKLACEKMSMENPELYKSIQMPDEGKEIMRLAIAVEYELLWAKVAKVGTSSWRHNFQILRNHSSNHSEEISEFREAKEKKIDLQSYWNKKRREGFIAFTFTRHPFERLVAAYRGKLEDSTRNEGSKLYHEKYGTYIVSKYRSNRTREFIRQEECTWLEFVHYLLEEENVTDHHWKPMAYLIYPCDLEYDVYGRLHSFNDDSWYIILKNNLEHLIGARWDNKGNLGSSSQKYIRKLPIYLREALYEKYRADFELFGYDVEEYLGYTLNTLKK